MSKRSTLLPFWLLMSLLLVSCNGTSPPPPSPQEDGGSSTLTVAVSGSGSGRVTISPPGTDCVDSCSLVLETGTGVVLTAVAERGSRFAGWSESCSGAESACTLELSADMAVTATFTDEAVPGSDPDGDSDPEGEPDGDGEDSPQTPSEPADEPENPPTTPPASDEPEDQSVFTFGPAESTGPLVVNFEY